MYLKSVHKVLMVAEHHPLLETAVDKPGFPYPWVDLSRFAGENYISPFQEFDSYLGYPEFPEKYGFYPRIICRMRTFRTAAWSVSKGIGVAVAPDQMVRRECIGDLPIRRLSFGDNPLATDALHLVYRKGHYLSRAAQFLMELCRQAYQEE
jgi:DNA-binding transcriptional LysR family regulator